VIRLAALLALAALPALADDAPAAGRAWTRDECVAEALARSGQVAEGRAKISEWQARLAEVEST